MEGFGVFCATLLAVALVLWTTWSTLWWFETGERQRRCEETHNVHTCVIQYVPYTQEVDE